MRGVGAGARGVKREGDYVDGLALPAPKRRPERLLPFSFGPAELADLATALRAYVNLKNDTSAPVTSWSNLIARKWPREYALSKQALGLKCSAQKVQEAIDKNLLNRYSDLWGWRGGWPAEAEVYPPCRITVQNGYRASQPVQPVDEAAAAAVAAAVEEAVEEPVGDLNKVVGELTQ